MANQITPNPSVPSQVVQEVKFPQFVNNLGIIPTSYKDSMNYYETLAWLCKYLEETVIPTVNENGEAVEELQSLYVELNSYVTHYFDNLNVQQEINNKLDEMLETGELEEIFKQYFKPIKDDLDAEIYSQNVKIDTIQREVGSLTTSINPIPVSDISEMTNTSRIYVLLSNGNWYYYNGETWASGGVYQAQVTDDAVENLQKTKISKVTVKNLYNPSQAVAGYINATNGTITSSTTFVTSDYIYLAEDDVLKIDSPIRYIGLYDTSKVFDSMITTSQAFGYTYTATSNCYVRITFLKQVNNNAIVYKNNSKDTLEYIPLNIEENVKLNGMQKAQIEQMLQKITGYEDTSVPLEFVEGHLYNWQTNSISENNNNQYCIIPVNAGDVYVIDGYSYHAVILATIVNENVEQVLIPSTGYSNDVLHTQDYEFIVPFTGNLYINRIGTRNVTLKKRTSVVRDISNLVYLLNSNCLYNKKIAFLGDSFTHGDFSHSPTDDYYITEGLYTGEYKVYPYLIGNRNNMNVDNLAVNGMTLAQYEDASNVLSKDGGAYTQIDNDTDYIIIKIGINDDVSHHNIPIGAISDTSNTTFYGAFNKVMNYLIEHYPNAKIGIIASNGISTIDYITATLNIAEKYGVKCLNESSDYNVPLLIRCIKPNVESSIRIARNNEWQVNTSQETPNSHPNAKCHEYESYIVEDFIRSL